MDDRRVRESETSPGPGGEDVYRERVSREGLKVCPNRLSR
jgi:hypothetical protein